MALLNLAFELQAVPSQEDDPLHQIEFVLPDSVPRLPIDFLSFIYFCDII